MERYSQYEVSIFHMAQRIFERKNPIKLWESVDMDLLRGVIMSDDAVIFWTLVVWACGYCVGAVYYVRQYLRARRG